MSQWWVTPKEWLSKACRSRSSGKNLGSLSDYWQKERQGRNEIPTEECTVQMMAVQLCSKPVPGSRMLTTPKVLQNPEKQNIHSIYSNICVQGQLGGSSEHLPWGRCPCPQLLALGKEGTCPGLHLAHPSQSPGDMSSARINTFSPWPSAFKLIHYMKEHKPTQETKNSPIVDVDRMDFRGLFVWSCSLVW